MCVPILQLTSFQLLKSRKLNNILDIGILPSKMVQWVVETSQKMVVMVNAGGFAPKAMGQ